MSERSFFFLHIMKTGGGTLRRQVVGNFERDQVYPCKGVDHPRRRAMVSIDQLANLPASRRDRIRFYTGHFPFVAVELLGEPVSTFTIVRDPVERTLSYLRRHRRERDGGAGRSLEEIYEDPLVFHCFVRDHQAKQFAMTAEDRPRTYFDVLEVDAGRLRLAKRNLERVDVVGTQDRFEELGAELERRFGWRRRDVGRWNVGEPTPGDAPASFRRRIAEDNRADMEFFEHARELCARRRPATMPG